MPYRLPLRLSAFVIVWLLAVTGCSSDRQCRGATCPPPPNGSSGVRTTAGASLWPEPRVTTDTFQGLLSDAELEEALRQIGEELEKVNPNERPLGSAGGVGRDSAWESSSTPRRSRRDTRSPARAGAGASWTPLESSRKPVCLSSEHDGEPGAGSGVGCRPSSPRTRGAGARLPAGGRLTTRGPHCLNVRTSKSASSRQSARTVDRDDGERRHSRVALRRAI
jgi:hypothetical protein